MSFIPAGTDLGVKLLNSYTHTPWWCVPPRPRCRPPVIREAVSSSGKAFGVSDHPAITTGSIGDSQPVVLPPPGDDCHALMAVPGLTIPQKGGLTGIEMASAIVGASIEQEAVSPSGGTLRVCNIPLAGTGMGGHDQTAAVEPPGGLGTKDL